MPSWSRLAAQQLGITGQRGSFDRQLALGTTILDGATKGALARSGGWLNRLGLAFDPDKEFRGGRDLYRQSSTSSPSPTPTPTPTPTPGGLPAWLPVGATAGIDFTEGEAWLGDALITDMATLFGTFDFGVGVTGSPLGYDADAFSAAGMSVRDADEIGPYPIGALLTKLLAKDYCMVIKWDQDAFVLATQKIALLKIYSGDDYVRAAGDGFEITQYEDESALYVSDFNGAYIPTANGVISDDVNKVAVSLNVDGLIFSLNGGTAVEDAFGVPEAMAHAWMGVGLDSSTVGEDLTEVRRQPINGAFRSIIFYPNGKSASEVEALSAP